MSTPAPVTSPASPASKSAPATTLPSTTTTAASTDTSKSTPSVTADIMAGGVGVTISVSLSLIFYILFSYGAAKLSYDKFQSVGWAILAFIFSTFYYPYHAIFLNSSAPPAVAPIMGMGRRR
jgi:hypothetical protein